MSERDEKRGGAGCGTVGCFTLGVFGFVGLPLYVLSVGPVVWLVEGTRWEWVCLIYFPIGVLASLCPPVDRVLQWYVELWRG